MIIAASRIPDINTSTIYEFREKIGVSQISVYLDLKRQFIWRLTDCECENSVDIDSIRLKLAESSSWYNASMCLELPFPNSGRVPTNHIFFRPVITDIFFSGPLGGKTSGKQAVYTLTFQLSSWYIPTEKRYHLDSFGLYIRPSGERGSNNDCVYIFSTSLQHLKASGREQREWTRTERAASASATRAIAEKLVKTRGAEGSGDVSLVFPLMRLTPFYLETLVLKKEKFCRHSVFLTRTRPACPWNPQKLVEHVFLPHKTFAKLFLFFLSVIFLSMQCAQ